MKKKQLITSWYVVLVICCVCSMMLNAFLIIRGGYIEKVLIKLNLMEEHPVVNRTLESWENCISQLNTDVDIAFLGDSITYGGNWQYALPQYNVINFGQPGDTLSGMLDRVNLLQAADPDVIVVMGGINGFKNRSEEQSIEQYTRLLMKIQEELPDAKVIVQSCAPVAKEKESDYGTNSDIESFNERLYELAMHYDLLWLDVHALYVGADGCLNEELSLDGIHIKPEAYEQWYSLLREMLSVIGS